MVLYNLLIFRKKRYLAKRVLKVLCASLLRTITVYRYGRAQDVDLFVNPSSSDIKVIKNTTNSTYVRFIADAQHKRLYIWAGSFALHDQVANALDISTGVHYSDHYLVGEADITGAQLILTNIDNYPIDQSVRRLTRPEWAWVQRYIDVPEHY